MERVLIEVKQFPKALNKRLSEIFGYPEERPSLFVSDFAEAIKGLKLSAEKQEQQHQFLMTADELIEEISRLSQDAAWRLCEAVERAHENFMVIFTDQEATPVVKSR